MPPTAATPPDIITRFIVEGRPRFWSPFRIGNQWNPKTHKYDKVWVRNVRRIYVTKKGGFTLRHGNGARGLLTMEEAAAARKKFRLRGWVMTLTKKQIDRYPWLSGDVDSDADLLRKLNSLGKVLNKVININSGLRTVAEQAVLYDNYLHHGGPLAAPPGQSNHNFGRAADCAIGGINLLSFSPAVRREAKKLGLCFPVAGEAWHVEVGNVWAN